MKEKILCFDLDDTLIDDNYKFEVTFCECIMVIIKALETRSPQIDTILQTARDFDNHLWETLPKEERYRPSRVARSWMHAYEKIATDVGIPVRKHISRLLWSLVMTNYDPPYFIIPDVIETLSELKKRDYRMHVITVGHPKIQMRKLNVSRLARYFEKAHVLTHDKSEVLKQLADEVGVKNIVMIGNSMRSDINPALELGIEAIYIPRGNWHMFKAEPVNSNFTTLKSIGEVAAMFN